MVLTSTGPNVTSLIDDGLEAQTQYFYRARALKGELTSSWSPTADATTLSDALAVVSSISETIEAVLPQPGTPLADRNLLEETRTVASALSEVPGVDTVLVLERVLTATALLEDGSVHLFVNNRPPLPDIAPVAHGSVPILNSNVVPLAGKTPQPPGSASAVVASYDGGVAEAAEVAMLFTDAGYSVLPLGASLADMRRYQNLGALYLDTHSTAFIRPRRQSDGTLDISEQKFSLQTSTIVAGSNLASIRGELVSGDVVYKTVELEDGRRETYLAVTESFIAKHWSFSGGAVVLHACYAGALGPFTEGENGGLLLDPIPIQDAVLNAGANVLMAFNNQTSTKFALPSILHFLDRTLGAGRHNPESPPTRPFGDQQVEQDMRMRGLLTFTVPVGEFLGFTWGGDRVNVNFRRRQQGSDPREVVLAPSIKNLDVVDDIADQTGELTLTGAFGDRVGTVDVEGTPVQTETWENETIVARIPFSGPGSAGPVTVRTPDNIGSNRVPLTEWFGTVTTTLETDGTLKAEAIMNVRFRADVHRFRSSLVDAAQTRQVKSYFSGASSGMSEGSGSWSSGGTEVTYSGNYGMDLMSKARVDGPNSLPTNAEFGGFAHLTPAEEKAEICMVVWAQIDIGVDSGGQPTQTSPIIFMIPPELADRRERHLACVTASLDDDTFVIASGGNSAIVNGDNTVTLSWSEFRPFAPPEQDTPG